MRFPFSLTWAMSRYIIRKKWEKNQKFPMVLMLEPLHRCNLKCSGCGRVREYQKTIHQEMTLEDCLHSVDECGAPIVSLCGGEPLLYQDLPLLIQEILKRNKHIYLCTNGTLLEKALPKLEQIQNRYLKKRLFLNIHLDGPAEIHDKITNQSGVFDLALNGIKMAKKAGFPLYTNTTVYRSTTVDSLIEMAKTLHEIPIDGMMISPAFEFSTVYPEHQTTFKNQSDQQDNFLTRNEIIDFFQQIRIPMKQFRLTATPVFLDFLCGKLSLDCAAWANPTRNPCGWRSPCYLIGNQHFATYRDYMEKTDWDKIGYKKDQRCENCMTHCGFEPASVLQIRKVSTLIRLALWEIFS